MIAARLAPIAAIALAGCASSPRIPASVPHPLAGAVAPDLGAAAPDGEPRATVVEFWASWCEACRESMPALEALWRARREDGLVVVGVNEDDDEALAARATRLLHVSFPVVHDGAGELAARYRVGTLPLTFVVDGVGMVRWVGHSPIDASRAATALLGPRP
jgi:cytochrome c biogenesis protein CcmG/thiol:disulfide interchange protein DsbE